MTETTIHAHDVNLDTAMNDLINSPLDSTHQLLFILIL